MLWAALHFPSLQSQALSRGHAPPEAGRQALAAVATWLGQFTPKVTLEPPDGMAAEVQGSLRLFGGKGRQSQEGFPFLWAQGCDDAPQLDDTAGITTVAHHLEEACSA